MRNHESAVLAALTVALLSSQANAQSESVPPWRQSDATLVQLCFDGLGADAPKSLRATGISERSILSENFALVGRTLTDRPIYQASFSHPTLFRSLIVALPTANVQLKIDAPADFHKYIDVWRAVPATVCTADGDASFKVLNHKPLEQLVACPEVGISASMKVASSSENSLTLVHVRINGPSTFNGLRGCREFVYRPK